MSAYMVFVRDRVTDPEELKKYEEGVAAASAGHPMTPLAFYGAVETLFSGHVVGRREIIRDFPLHPPNPRTSHRSKWTSAYPVISLIDHGQVPIACSGSAQGA